MTLPELRQQYEQQRRALIERYAKQRLTQTEAARELGVSLTALNNIIRRENIFWPVKHQGAPRKETE